MAESDTQGERPAREASEAVVRQFAPPRGAVQGQLDRLLAAQARIAAATARLSRARESICGARPGAAKEVMRGPTTATDLLGALAALAEGYERLAGDLDVDAQDIAALF